MSSEPPEGWVNAPLGDGVVASAQPGFACGAHNRTDGVPHLRPMNVSEEGRLTLTDLKFVPKSEVYREERWVKQGDVVFNNTNSPELVGKTAYYGESEPRAFSNHMTRLRCRQGLIDSAFCAMVLHKLWRNGYFQAVSNNHVSQASVSRTVLLDTVIPIPPLPEQRRIVEKVELLLARVGAARDRLSKIPTTLKRFREMILADACCGRLTAAWRENHATAQPPSLVEVTDQRARSGRRGANLSGGHALLVDEEMPQLPVCWTYARADRVVAPETVITYGIVLPGPEVPGGIPYVRQQDIDEGVVRVKQLRHTTPEIAKKHERSSLKEGDVLLCIIRNLRVAIVPKGIDRANLTQGTVRMRPDGRLILGPYLAAYLASPWAQGWMKRRYFGMDMPRINVEDARAIPIALPHVEEQREIMRRVQALFALADAIERRVAGATGRANKLMDAILGRAFNGALVPTEAELARQEGREYEPASVLLERVRAEGPGNGNSGRTVTSPHSREPRRTQRQTTQVGEAGMRKALGSHDARRGPRGPLASRRGWQRRVR